MPVLGGTSPKNTQIIAVHKKVRFPVIQVTY
jgi:hypothetical protein